MLCVAINACSRKQTGGGPQTALPVPVLTAKVEQKAAPVMIEAIGEVQAYATVAIKPQVTGQLAKVHFHEGQEVKPGDLLFSIDHRPFEVALHEAQAELDKARANADNATRQAKRYTELNRRGAVAAEQFETIELARATSAAALKSAEAAVRKAELELEYCTIRSPIAGRTGNRLADAGNVVSANATELVVINQIEPVYISCTVAERFLGELQRYLATPEGVLARATVEGKAGAVAEGPVTFLNNAVKTGSGTIQLKATFANENLALWPGQFVAVELILATQPDAILAPDRAVSTGQSGQYVYVVGDDLSVKARHVTVDRRVGRQMVIREGLKAGEVVVIDGQSQLLPDSKVQIRTSISADEPDAAVVPDAAKAGKAGDAPGQEGRS